MSTIEDLPGKGKGGEMDGAGDRFISHPPKRKHGHPFRKNMGG